jgi:hypothetical protein
VSGRSGLLADYPGAAAAYSLRLLDTNYTGSAIRVRRASDNAEQDIGFDSNGDLDTTALATFCSGTDGFVKVWYCQSGNGNDAEQTTTGSQPKIYDSSSGYLGHIDTLGSSLMNMSYTLPAEFSVYHVGATLDLNDTCLLLTQRDVGLTGRVFFYLSRTNGSLLNSIQVDGVFNAFTGTPDTNEHLNVFRRYNSEVVTRFDGVGGTAVASTVAPFAVNADLFAGLTMGQPNIRRQTIKELIVYPDGNTNDTGIETNINDYYSIFTP